MALACLELCPLHFSAMKKAHRAVRVEVLNYMKEIWDDQLQCGTRIEHKTEKCAPFKGYPHSQWVNYVSKNGHANYLGWQHWAWSCCSVVENTHQSVLLWEPEIPTKELDNIWCADCTIQRTHHVIGVDKRWSLRLCYWVVLALFPHTCFVMFIELVS